MTRLRVALDTEQCGGVIAREPGDDPIQVDRIEDLLDVAPAVLRSEEHTGALAATEAIILAVGPLSALREPLDPPGQPTCLPS